MRVNSRSTRALVVVAFIGSLILFAPQARSGASTMGCASTPRTTPVISRGTLFFTATDGTHGRELWKSDGTCTGTALVADIRPGHGSSEVNELTEISRTVFFRANDGTHGAQVWKTDGTKAGTVMLTDIALGDAGPSPYGLTASGSTLFFVAYSTSISGDPELWKSDGTVAGTVMVKDLMPTSTSGGFAYVGHPMDVSGTLFFGAQEGGGDGELWKSDGTTAGTLVLKHFGQTQAFSEPSLVGSIGRTLLFVADDGVSGGELWRSDGTESGTEIVRDIAPGQASSMPLGSGAGTERGPYYLLGMLVGDELYFDAFNASLGFELWKSDGTTDGTQVVKDIFPGPKSSASTGSMLTQAGGKVYFAAQTRPHAWGLWTSDGTETGTQLLVSPSTDATWLNATAVGGVAFVVDELRSGGSSLWKTDGTRRGTLMVKNFRGKASVAWYSPVEVGPRLLFAASDGLHGWEPWSSDGTQSGTLMTRDINLHGSALCRYGVPYGSFTTIGNTAFFGAREERHGGELWTSDGRGEGTVEVRDINPGPESSRPAEFLYVPA